MREREGRGERGRDEGGEGGEERRKGREGRGYTDTSPPDIFPSFLDHNSCEAGELWFPAEHSAV